jgi:hypothetical protein
VAKAEWRQNEPIVVNVYLLNNGRECVILTGCGDWRDYQISLVDENDRPVPYERELISNTIMFSVVE